MRVYNPRDDNCTGIGLGAVLPETAEVQEDAGGEYVLRLGVPIAEGTGWDLMAIDNQVAAQCPVLNGIKAQRFRIHAVSVTDGGTRVDVQARHISYDLQYVTADTGEESGTKVSAAQAGEALWGAIYGGDCGFSLTITADANVHKGWGRCSVTRALLDQTSGLVRAAKARLVRDNTSILLMPSSGLDSGVIIRYGVDLLGLSADGDATECYTRLMPTGQDKEGNPVYLPERVIDSPRLSAYARPRVYTWQVSGARVGSRIKTGDGEEKTLAIEDVYGLLREAAQDKLDNGCDLPRSAGTVEYIDLERTQEHHGLAELQHIRLYEQVSAVHPPIRLAMKKTVCGYVWDALRLRYTQLKLGDPFSDGGEGSFVTSAQAAAAGRASGAGAAYTAQQVEQIIWQMAVYDQFIKDQTEYTNALSIRMDATEGTITQLGESMQVQLDGQQTTMNTVKQELNAMDARIDLKANSDMVEGLDADLRAAVVRINGHDAAISQLASKSDIDALKIRVSQAEADIDGAQAEILLKASQEDMDRLGGDLGNVTTRLSQAEIDIDGAQAEIALKVSEDGIINAINLSTEGVRIAAGKIELDGYVTMDDFEALSGEVIRLTGDTLVADKASISTLNAEAIVGVSSIGADAGFFATMEISGSLTIGGEDAATKAWVNGESQAARAVKTMSASGNTLTLELYDGATVNFKKASVAALDQTWSGGRLTISTSTSGITLSGEVTASVDSTPQNVVWHLDEDEPPLEAVFDVISDRGTIVPGMKLDAETPYNTGWNACRDACKAVSNVYTISRTAPGTMYYYTNGVYANMGSSWVQVDTKTGLYTRPAKKTV